MKPECRKLGRRAFVRRLGAGGLTIVAANLRGSGRGSERVGATLENGTLRLAFDWDTGSLTGIQNKLSNESLRVHGDDFAVVAEEFSLSPRKMRLESLQKSSPEVVEATYGAEGRQVVAIYKLGPNNHFVEKQLVITSPSAFRLKTLVVSKVGFSGTGLKMVKYPYLHNVTYFGRSERGGIFLGVELPFDASSLAGDGMVTLGYQPSLKVKAQERPESEPIYLGVCRRRSEEKEEAALPLPSESEAMVAMTSTILGPPRHGLWTTVSGWQSELMHQTYYTEAQVEGDMRSIDFLAECGIDSVGINPWSGDIDQVNSLRGGDHYQPGPLPRKLLEYAAKKKVGIQFWPTMTNTDGWWPEKGRPFRPDRPDWVMFPEKRTLVGQLFTGESFRASVIGNCLANEPFYEWLMGIQFDGMRTGYFSGWGMDGDFFGGQGFVLPANCPSDQHDHLPGDSNYACERTLNRMIARIRQAYPNVFIDLGRPPMDLGIWSSRGADAMFTLDEVGVPVPLPGMGKQPINVTMGDKVRRWSRIRVHHHFFPHYVDWPQIFANPKSYGSKGADWQREKIDYVMLSGLSCSPYQVYYLPTKAGIPAQDKAEIRKWLEWGRKNIRYLHVRKDLPQWPEAGKVDGSAHIVEDRGLIFLFNPNPTPLPGRFRLDRESIGITKGSRFEVAQVYPASKTKQQLSWGQEVVVAVPPQGAVVLWLAPMTSS